MPHTIKQSLPIVLKRLLMLIDLNEKFKELISNLFKKYIPISVLSFILFCKYDQVFLLSWLFRTREEQIKAPKTFVYRRFSQSLYTFITWVKARILYYANNWIYTTNHKRIAVNYFWFVILSGIFGMVLATVIRLELAYPGVGIFAGDSLQYLSLATAHGVIMVFFMIIPLISGAFANFLLPTQLGVHDVAFPRLNSAAFWFLPGGLMMLGQLICLDRRYQRMNCFNIREAQALLKKRFFVDLINSNDHHTLLSKTMLGLRFKTQDLSVTHANGRLASTFGLSRLLSNRSFSSSTSLENIQLMPIDFLTSQALSKIINSYKIPSFLNRILLEVIFFLQNPVTILRNLINSFSLAFSKNSIEPLVGLNVFSIALFDFYEFLSTHWTNFKLYRAANWKIFSRKVTRSRLYKMRPRRHDLDRLSLDIFFDPFDYALDEEINPLAFSFSNPFGYININKNMRFTFIFHILSESFIGKNNLALQINEVYANLFVTYNKYISLFSHLRNRILSKTPRFYEFFRLFNSQVDYKLHKVKVVSEDSWVVLIRGLVDYWSSTGSVVVSSSLLAYENFFKIRSFRTLGFAHKDYSDFLSIWYLPTVLNQDDLPFIEAADFIHKFKLYNEIFLFKASVFWISLNDSFCLMNSFLSNFEAPRLIVKNLIITFVDKLSTNLPTKISDTFLPVTVIKVLIQRGSYWLTFTQTKLVALDVLDNSMALSTFKINNLTSSLTKLLTNEETLNNHRGLRFHNPVFCYDYRAGDYFPKFYQENITYLLPTFAKITGGVRTPIWFLSELSTKTMKINFEGFFDLAGARKLRKKFFISARSENRSAPTFFFYNFFSTFSKSKSKTPFYWTPFTTLTEKFEVMFTSTSMQERMYTNWRQLKFTREAWRCKLLMARHQKSLFRRYVRENGIFWAIERNARDLLPGWAMITPFSSRTRFTAIGKVDIGVSAILLVLISSVISGANFLVTYRYLSTLNNRKMRDARSFFTEGIMCSSWMMIAANPMLMIGLIMLLSDRHWQTSFFDYSGGGDTILFQHMFWFFGHPEVYIVIIPTFGFVNTLFSYYLRKRISARASLLYSIYTIAFLGFFVWGHHMYMVGLSHTTRMLFSTLTVMISVPAATKLMHWCVTLVNSAFVVELPFLFMLTYVFLFVSGGISGMCVAHTGMDILFHDTFYVIGHFHVMFAGAAMFGSFGAFYFYFSAIFGVKYSRVYAYMHFIYYLLGQLLTVIPMFWLGYAGMPRRVLDYPSAFGGWHSIITAGHMLSVAGLISFFMMIFDSLRQSKAATRTTLGIIRYNTRLNFYFYESSRISFAQQKGSYQYRYFRPTSFKLNGFHYTNYEYLETTLYSYALHKRK